MITTLLIVADNSDVEVACFERNVRTRLSSNMSPEQLTTDDVTESPYSYTAQSLLSDETVEPTNRVTNSDHSTEIVPRNTILIIFIVAVLGIIFHMRKK